MTELVANRFAEAEKAYSGSMTACAAAVDADAECIARAQVGLAFALAAQEKFDDAVTWYGRSLVAFSQLKMEEAGARARLGLSDALYGRGDYEKALEQAAAARTTATARDAGDVLWRALIAAARSERKLGNSDGALDSARAAVLTVRRMAAAAMEKPATAAPADTASAYAALALLQAEKPDAAAAFNTLEEMRVHALRAALAGSEREIARGMTTEERAEEQRLDTAVTTLMAQQRSERNLPKPDAARLAKLQVAIEAATATRAAARQRLFARVPDLRTWRGLAPAATAEDLPRLLDIDGKVLLQFLVDDHDVVILLAWLKPGESTASVRAFVRPVKRQDLAQRIVRAMDGNALGSVEAWRAASKDLFSILPAEIVAQLTTAKAVIVVPDDTLWRIPFEALPIRDRFLADRTSVTYATSLTAAITPPPSITQSAAAPRVVAIAAPVLAAALVDELKVTAPTWTLRSSEAAGLELAGVNQRAKETGAQPVVLTGSAATKGAAAAAAAVAAADALHVAAPFRVNSASPLFSAMLLSEAGPAKTGDERRPPAARLANQDVQLYAREIFNLASSARLVMLSDPATLSMPDASRGIAPIQWAWRATGAATLILRRWAGGEEFSNRVIATFYEQVAAGKTPGEALEVARAAVRNTDTGRAPAAWAGWIVISGR